MDNQDTYDVHVVYITLGRKHKTLILSTVHLGFTLVSHTKDPLIPFPVYSNNNTVYLEILAVIKFGDLPEICQKCIIGGI